MGLIDRLQSDGQGAPSAAGPSLFAIDTRQLIAASNEDAGKVRFQALKGRIQDLLLKKIDVTKLEDAGYAPLLAQVNAVIDELVDEEHLLLAEADRERLIEATTSDMLGLGPLEPLLQDNDISDFRVAMFHRHFVNVSLSITNVIVFCDKTTGAVRFLALFACIG